MLQPEGEELRVPVQPLRVLGIDLGTTNSTAAEINWILHHGSPSPARCLEGDQRANHARLKSALEFGRGEMSEGSELHQSTLRAVLYAVMELQNNMDGDEVLAHLTLNIPNYYGDTTQRQLAIELADYLVRRLETLRPDEASAARVLCELVKNQRLG
jgi:putative DNA methylase